MLHQSMLRSIRFTPAPIVCKPLCILLPQYHRALGRDSISSYGHHIKLYAPDSYYHRIHLTREALVSSMLMEHLTLEEAQTAQIARYVYFACNAVSFPSYIPLALADSAS